MSGYGKLSNMDIKESSQFLHKYLSTCPKFIRGRAIDCGAGIGRITD